MARAVLAVLGGALLACAGCAVPEPAGARAASAHYEVRTDEPGSRFAREVAASAEEAHAVLAREYGVAPEGDGFPVVVFHHREAFDRELAPELRDKGFVGEYADRFALVFWPDDLSGRDTLAHELVHRFNAACLGELPYWLDEGLAKALAPKRAHGDWLGAVAGLDDAELRARIRSLDALPEGDDYALRCLVAAALVRCELDSGNLASIREIRGFRPDADRFLRWLRAGAKPTARRFEPVWKRESEPGGAFSRAFPAERD